MTKSARGGGVHDDHPPVDPVVYDDDVEAQLLKETLGAGLAAAAIFAASSQAASYPVPSPPGTSDAAAELAAIPQRDQVTRRVQQATRPAVKKAVKAKKAKRTQRSSTRGGAGGGRGQPA